MPGPPPFSSMNSTPAASMGRLMAKLFAAVSAIRSSAISARLIVFTARTDASASSSAGFDLEFLCFPVVPVT